MLKMNKIVPVHKKGDIHLMENYRPVALISIFSKIFEYCFLSRLEPFLEKNRTLSPYQFGFRRNCSTMTAIHHFYGKLVDLMESGERPVGIFCDLSRAFDCVDHRLLLGKMEAYGVRGPALGWLTSFLRDRRQFVSVSYGDPGMGRECFTSDINTIGLGVPQGSVLGPILFTCYINDLASVVNPGWTMALFADDSSFIISSPDHTSLEDMCSVGMGSLMQWFNNNSLHLNGSKTSYVRFHTPQTKTIDNLNILVGGEAIDRSAHLKFLGLIMDQNLDWKEHCNMLCSKLSSLCFMMRNLRLVLPQHELLSVYNAYVGSRLHYGICFWGSSSSAKNVFVAQKRVMRAMLGVSPGTSCRSQFARLGLLTLAGIFIYELSKYIYLNKSNYLQHANIHSYPTRGRDSLYVRLSRLNIGKNSPQNLGPAVFNRLRGHVGTDHGFLSFKRNLKRFLINREFYSLDEFWNI